MFSDIFRRRSIKASLSAEPTGLVSLSEIHSYFALLDVREPSFPDCRVAVEKFFCERHIPGKMFFFDLGNRAVDDLLLADAPITLVGRDLNWYGKPVGGKADRMFSSRSDLFLSLVPRASFTLDYVAHRYDARLKLGRSLFGNSVFDIVVLDPRGKRLTSLQVFQEMTEILSRIR